MSQGILLQQITLGATNLESMVVFYNSVFDAAMIRQQADSVEIYEGRIGDIAFVLYPVGQEAQVAAENRQRLRFQVNELDLLLQVAANFGGRASKPMTVEDRIRYATVIDPDGRVVELIENLPLGHNQPGLFDNVPDGSKN